MEFAEFIGSNVEVPGLVLIGFALSWLSAMLGAAATWFMNLGFLKAKEWKV
jgi:hypothetical protein